MDIKEIFIKNVDKISQILNENTGDCCMITNECDIDGIYISDRILHQIFKLPELENFNINDFNFSKCVKDSEEILNLKNENEDYSLLHGKSIKESNSNLCNVNKFYNLANTSCCGNTILSILNIEFDDFPIDEMLNITTENLQVNS